MRIILASASPRRKELLSTIVNKYEIVPSDFDEETLKNEIKNPEVLVQELSINKAEDVLNKVNNKIENDEFVIIAADTIVYFNDKVLGKPKDELDAFNMLSALQGNDNYVYTGMTVIIKNNKENNNENKSKNNIKKETVFTKSVVTMKKMTEKDIWDYIKTKDPLDKAGAYAIQGIGNKNIEKFEGSFNAVVGLDVDKLKEILIKNNVIVGEK